VTPTVSVVIPARNEERFIAACLGSVFAQQFEGELEVIVVDGNSTDATVDIATRLGARVIANPDGSIPAALNQGLAAARADVLVRFDAHGEMTPGYLEASLRTLAEVPDAVNVGGWRSPVGASPWGEAISAALASPFGVGNPKLWREPSPGSGRRDVETVPAGAFRTARLREVGGWREDLLANEDFELNHRLRANGGRVVFDPGVHAIYHARESYPEIVQQYWRYGRWKAVVMLTAPGSLRARQLAPPALLVVLAAAPFSRRARLGVACYAALLVAATARTRDGWRTTATLASMHLAWAGGLAAGFAQELTERRRR
jgi:succinoglycan biosynthesis protein ExoA